MLITHITAKEAIIPIFKGILENNKKRTITSNPTEKWAKAMNSQQKNDNINSLYVYEKIPNLIHN